MMFRSEQWGSCVCQQMAAVISPISLLNSVTISEQRVTMCYTNLLENVGEYFDVNFAMESVPTGRAVHSLVSKLGSNGTLKTRNKNILPECQLKKNLDDTGARLDHTPRKSLKRLAQERQQKLLKVRP
jgi:hypothetical protein